MLIVQEGEWIELYKGLTDISYANVEVAQDKMYCTSITGHRFGDIMKPSPTPAAIEVL